MATRIRPLIGAPARALVQRHLDDDSLVAIVTATNSFVTGPIAREFGIAHLIATIPAQENGRFTGKPRGTPSFKAGKIERVEAWLESLGLWWGSFDAQLVLQRFAQRPAAAGQGQPPGGRRSRRHAARATPQAHGWPIISLRGLIYGIIAALFRAHRPSA